MSLTPLFEKRFRGFRVVEIAAFLCLTTLVLGVYFTKAHAGHETAEITDVDRQIADTQRRVRLLDAEVAHLEAPNRVEALSEQYLGFQPISAKHEASESGLMEIAREASAPPPPPAGKVDAATSPAAPKAASVATQASAVQGAAR